jgi:hypothetical protein
MPISDSQADKLINRIDRLVEALANKQSAGDDPAALARLEERLGWHKGVGWIAISITATAFLFLFGFMFLRMPQRADVENAVSNGVGPVNEKISAINEKLAVLTTRMEFLKADVSKNLPQAMKQSLQQTGDLELGLKTVAALATEAQERRVTSDPKEIAEVVRDLVSIKVRNSDFWRASTSLLNYRSFDVSPKQTASLSTANLQDCTTSDPAPMTVTEVSPSPIGGVKRLSNAYYENCRFTLDSAEDDRRINSIVVNKFPTIEFRHCLIVYRGRDFSLITWTQIEHAPLVALTGKGSGARVSYNGPSLQFVECLFDFSVSEPMPERGKEITEALLAQAGPSLTLPIKTDASHSPSTRF